MRTLIVGAKGMLGGMLAVVLADWQPVEWDRDELDITDGAAVRAKLEQLKPEVIINAAGYTAVDQAEAEEEKAFAVNEGGVRHLAHVAFALGATMVHYSTDYVFAGTKQDGYAEADPPGPAVNTYGASKLAGEQALTAVNPRYFLVRTAWLYGPGGQNFVDTIRRLTKEREEIQVVDDQYGNPTYTKDVAEATRALLEGTYTPGVYHVVNDGQATWYELARRIVAQLHLPTKVVSIPSSAYPLPARRPRYSILRNTRGPRLRPWQTALDEYLRSR